MCGLMGYNGVEAPDPDKLKILWMYNLGRGDDSCGVFWDGLLRKGVGTKANVFNFLEATTLKPIEKYFTVIGHTRKSTVGSHTTDNAHPFGFYTQKNHDEGKKKGGLENVVPYAVGAHNGIIRNRVELRNKYGKKYDYAVDSMEILNILVDSRAEEDNINVLKDYEGFAALMWTYTDENKLFVFRGKSSIGEDNTGERPLFYWKKRGSKAIYISSIKESLMVICDDDNKEECIKAFEPNKIHIVHDGQISTLKKSFNREGKGGTTSTSSNGSCSAPAALSTGGANRRKAKDVFIGFPEKLIKKCDDIARRDNNGCFFLEDEPFYNPFGNERVIFSKGRYHKNGHILGQKLKEGVTYLLDDNGNAPASKHYNALQGKSYFFWNGWLVKDKEALEWICKEYKKGHLEEVANKKKQLRLTLEFRMKFSESTLVFNDCKEGGFYGRGGTTEVYSTGRFIPAFNQDKVYQLESGYFKSVSLTKEEEPTTVEAEEIDDDKVENDPFSAEMVFNVEMYNLFIDTIDVVNRASETIADKDFGKDLNDGVVPKVSESLRSNLVKWLDEAWFHLTDNLKKYEEAAESEATENNNKSVVF